MSLWPRRSMIARGWAPREINRSAGVGEIVRKGGLHHAARRSALPLRRCSSQDTKETQGHSEDTSSVSFPVTVGHQRSDGSPGQRPFWTFPSDHGEWSWRESNPRPLRSHRPRYDHSRNVACGYRTAGSAGPEPTAGSFPEVSGLSLRSAVSPAVLHYFCCRAVVNRPRAPLLVTVSLLD